MKRFLALLGFLFFVTYFVFSQNLDLKYYSSLSDGDYANKYEGVAIALFLSDDDYNKMEPIFADIGKTIKKLTKNNEWLCRKALSEWELKDGERYFVMCSDNANSSDVILLFAVIKNDGESFDWWGKYIAEVDMKEIKEKLE